MAGSKSTQTRDNRIYYTSLRLLFSTMVHLLIMVDVFVECSIVCGRHSCRVVPQLSRWFGFISFDSIALLLVIFAPLKIYPIYGWMIYMTNCTCICGRGTPIIQSSTPLQQSTPPLHSTIPVHRIHIPDCVEVYQRSKKQTCSFLWSLMIVCN